MSAGRICKGTIASIDGEKCRVQPSDASEMPTPATIVIPWHLLEDAGELEKGTEVIYADFDDGTGILLARSDGKWGEAIPKLKIGGIEFADHVHGNVERGSSNTGKAK